MKTRETLQTGFLPDTNGEKHTRYQDIWHRDYYRRWTTEGSRLETVADQEPLHVAHHATARDGRTCALTATDRHMGSSMLQLQTNLACIRSCAKRAPSAKPAASQSKFLSLADDVEMAIVDLRACSTRSEYQAVRQGPILKYRSAKLSACAADDLLLSVMAFFLLVGASQAFCCPDSCPFEILLLCFRTGL